MGESPSRRVRVRVRVRVCMCTCASKEAKLQRMGSRMMLLICGSYFKLGKEELYTETHPRNRYFQFPYPRVWG